MLYSLLVIALFAVFRILRLVIPLLLVRKSALQGLTRWLFPIELFSWLFVLGWGCQRFLAKGALISTLVTAIIIIGILVYIIHFFIRDFVAGVFLRFSRHIGMHDTLKVGANEGTVSCMGLRTFQIETKDGRTIVLPYSKVITDTFERHKEEELLVSDKWHLKLLSKDELLERKEEIRTFIIQSSFSAPSKEPVFEYEAGLGELITTFYSPGKDLAERLKLDLERRFNKQENPND